MAEGSAKLAVPPLVWFDGEVVPWERATVHVWTDVAVSGMSIFEGLRAYWRPDQDRHQLLHLDRHLDRLDQSARLGRFPMPYSRDELVHGVNDLLRRLGYRQHVYLRPTVYLRKGRYVRNPSAAQAGAYVVAFPVDRDPGAERGIRCMVSSWRRPSDVVCPPRVKVGAGYYNIRLARIEADTYGFDEPIQLNDAGTVAETGGAAVFIRRGTELATPRITDSILESITRASVLELAREDPDLVVRERAVDRTELYAADEVFLAGTLAEVTPVVDVDGIAIGSGTPGPVTRRLRDRYAGICLGTDPHDRGWFTPGPVIPTEVVTEVTTG
jgi:branched-chain amino acid aminotransferase